jgi:hypothetical protein
MSSFQGFRSGRGGRARDGSGLELGRATAAQRRGYHDYQKRSPNASAAARGIIYELTDRDART